MGSPGLIWIQSLRAKFTLFFVVCVLVPFTVACFFILRQLTREALLNASEFMANNLNTVSRTVDEILKNVEFAYTPLLVDNEFIAAVKSMKPASARNSFEDYDPVTISQAMMNSYVTNNYIDSIYLYSPPATTSFVARGYTSVLPDDAMEESSWYRGYLSRGTGTRWILVDSDEEGYLLTSYREIREFGNPTVSGVISINVNDRVIESLFHQMRFKTSGYALATDGEHILSSGTVADDQLMRSIIDDIPEGAVGGYFRRPLDGTDTLAVYHVSAYSGLTYVALAPMREINTSSSIVTSYAIYIYLFMLAIFLASLALTYAYFYRPIKCLFSAMGIFEKGNFDVRLDAERSDEIGFINRHFNSMVENIKSLIDREYGNELAKKKAQLKAILSQINDHFLYNTLDSIHWLARKNGVNEICDVVFALSTFYRLNLSDGEDVVPVSAVGDMLESYLTIQQVRMADGLRYTISVAPRVKDTRVLKYLFQPIVENAVIHGIAGKPAGGNVTVRFEQSADTLVFTVTDTGVGIEPNILDLLRDPHADAAGYALHNIRDQIKLYYGTGSLAIDSEPGTGTTVTLTIPLTKEVTPCTNS